MAEQWLEWARGPVFLGAFSIMIVGLLRQWGLTVVGIFAAIRRASDKNIPYRQVVKRTLFWLLPFRYLGPQNRPIYSVLSFLFHVGLILTPVFLGAHVMLLKRGFGAGWPSLSQPLADGLTILTIATGIGLVVGRLCSRHSRRISRFQDFLLTPLLLVPFVSGFLAMHPTFNPFSYEATLVVHVMSANLVFVLLPFTKLAHVVLMPLTQLVAEVGWHFPSNSGRNVAVALGKEDEKI